VTTAARHEPRHGDGPLESSQRKDYHQAMSSTADRATVPAGWRESLERSKAQIAAGVTVPLIPILERLRASAERLEAADGQTQDEAETPSTR
jgi:hypothetical protein